LPFGDDRVNIFNDSWELIRSVVGSGGKGWASRRAFCLGKPASSLTTLARTRRSTPEQDAAKRDSETAVPFIRQQMPLRAVGVGKG
jgi:hypothetical protein